MEQIKSENPERYNPEKDLGRILTNMMNKMVQDNSTLDNEINILLGLNSAIFVFTATQIERNPDSAAILTILIFSAIASLSALLAIHPPKIFRRSTDERSLLSPDKIMSMDSFSRYKNELETTFADREKIIEEYALTIWNFSRYRKSKRVLFNISRNVLFLGISLSLFALLYQM